MNYDNYNLDTVLMELRTPSGKGVITARHSVEGTFVTGGIGSGKTSSLKTLAIKYLAEGWGGMVCTVKPDEKKMWQEYCRLANREDDLIIVERGGKHTFNFLEYETAHNPDDESFTDNVVDLLQVVINASQGKGAGKSDDRFWSDSLDLLIATVIDMCMLAYGRVTVTLMYDIVQTIPKSIQAFHDDADSSKAFYRAFQTARQYVETQISTWQANLSDDDKDRFGDSNEYESELLEAIPDMRLFKQIDQFFMDTFIGIGDKTRSIIDLTFTSFLHKLLREPVYSLFCRYQSTFTPEDSLKGKIILLNLPTKKYHKAGKDIQLMFKYIWQRAMEKRDVTKNGCPVFLWADEAQNFIHEKDTDFQATARSSRVATVYITQNLPNIFASMGGEKSEYRVKAFLGTLGTKFFFANADTMSNQYSSELIGDDYYIDQSESVTTAESFSQTTGKSRKLERVVRPEKFVSLRVGGPLNDYMTECYIHRQGDCILNGQNHIKMKFNQNYQPK